MDDFGFDLIGGDLSLVVDYFMEYFKEFVRQYILG
jgi:hypothetical protein